MSRNLVVVDIETTGLADVCVPLEVAAVNLDTGETLEFVPHVELSKVIIEPQALAINRYFERGVFRKMLSLAGTADMWESLSRMLDGNTFAGCNPTFDSRIVARYVGTIWHHRLADLSAYAACALGRDPANLPGLGDVLTVLKIENRCPHSALGDAEATAEAFRRLRKLYERL